MISQMAQLRSADLLQVNALLGQGFALHQAGRLAEAEEAYGRILAIDPGHADSRYLLGLIFHQRGDAAQAVRHIDLALDKNPDNILALNSRGAALNALKRFDEALASYDRSIALQPDFVEALLNRGNTLKELQRLDEALASFDRALAVQPDHAGAHYHRGVALHALERFDEALASYDRALALRPDYAEALANRGVALQALRRFDEALASFDRVLAALPDNAEVHVRRGEVLFELRRFPEALASCDRALALSPDCPEAHCNRGNALSMLERFDEALASYDRALALRPDYADAYANRGVTLLALKEFDAALRCLERALALQPDFPEAHCNEGFCRLLLGDFERGWAKHPWLWQTKQLKFAKRNFAEPPWTGSEDIAGKTVLLYAEHGLGDTIQFCRYAPGVAARGARVILEVQRPLRGLTSSLVTHGLADALQVVPRGDPLPPFDMQCSLLGLPLACGTRLATIPSEAPYLHPSAPAVADWNARLAPRTRPRIGLAWSGDPTHQNDHNRSIALADLLPALQGSVATLVSVQRELRPADAAVLQDRNDIVHFGEALQDFSDTAALIANLDLVITVDTSVAHLAGALAKPVWVLLPFIPDWRWLLDRDDSPWYPTARLFRQDDSRRWDGAVARLRAALHDFMPRN
jgi:tetratricopeptide (TPR) repeat protein